jgi:hypothetical protein
MKKKGWWSGSRCRPCVQAPVPGKKKKKAVIQYFNENFKKKSKFMIKKTALTDGIPVSAKPPSPTPPSFSHPTNTGGLSAEAGVCQLAHCQLL